MSKLAGLWGCTPLIPALGRQRQADLCEFEASLVYRESSRTARAEKSCLKSKAKQHTHKKVCTLGELARWLSKCLLSSLTEFNYWDTHGVKRQPNSLNFPLTFTVVYTERERERENVCVYTYIYLCVCVCVYMQNTHAYIKINLYYT